MRKHPFRGRRVSRPFPVSGDRPRPLLFRQIELVMAVCLILAAFVLARQGAIYVLSEKTDKEKICIAIDAGHGGSDPGKVGINNALEKDINLSVALKLKNMLEQKDIEVILTRDSDESLAPEGVTNQKAADMQTRCQIITEANPVFTVSIHQNSYPTPDIRGAQVFYFGQSEKGEALATILQENLVSRLDPDNRRTAKANESYYLLKKTPTPTVIVECGFLSNPEEAELLLDADYQNKLARAIYMGILEYLEKEGLL